MFFAAITVVYLWIEHHRAAQEFASTWTQGSDPDRRPLRPLTWSDMMTTRRGAFVGVDRFAPGTLAALGVAMSLGWLYCHYFYEGPSLGFFGV